MGREQGEELPAGPGLGPARCGWEQGERLPAGPGLEPALRSAVQLHETPALPNPPPAPAAAAGDVFLSWHAPSKRVLAVGVGGRVLLVAVPGSGMEQLEFDLSEGSTPGEGSAGGWLL